MQHSKHWLPPGIDSDSEQLGAHERYRTHDRIPTKFVTEITIVNIQRITPAAYSSDIGTMPTVRLP